MLLGLITIVGSFNDPLAAARGHHVGSAALDVGLGADNAQGGLALLLTGYLLLTVPRVGVVTGTRLAMAAAGLAPVAAVSLDAVTRSMSKAVTSRHDPLPSAAI